MDRIILNDNTKILFTYLECRACQEMYFYFSTDKTESEIREILTKENLKYLRICNRKDKVYGKYYNMYCKKVLTDENGVICASIFPIPEPPVEMPMPNN